MDQGTLDALAAYCQAWSRWTAAEAQVSTLGPVVKSPAGFPDAKAPRATGDRVGFDSTHAWGRGVRTRQGPPGLYTLPVRR